MTDLRDHDFPLSRRAAVSERGELAAVLDNFSLIRFNWLALLVTLLVLGAASLVQGETIPPKPARYFNDYARVIPPASANALDQELEQFERDTSNQLLVAVFRKMDSASSIEDYTVRVAQSWRVGQSEKKNGAVLFAFIEDRQMYIQVGYGLEPVLTDALSRQIIENEIVPRFRAGDFAGGLTAGVHAMMSAARGEYRGTGRTNADTRGVGRAHNGKNVGVIVLFIVVMMALGSRSRAARGNQPLSRRRTRGWRDDDHFGPGGGLGGFGGFGGGGGGGSSGGGGFSGGGGSFGGGGAGGRW